MAIIYSKLTDTLPIRSDDVAVSGATYVALEGRNSDTTSDSNKYDYAEKRIDYYFSKDDTNLKAVVAKVEIDATDNYKAAKKINYVETEAALTVGATVEVEVDGATYKWTATGVLPGAGAWADEDDNPVSFDLQIHDEILDAIITVNGTSYSKNYLWLKNVIENVAVNSAAPLTQTEGTGTFDTNISTNLGAENKLLDKASAANYTEEGHKGTLKFVKADANGDHEGKEVNIKYTIFVSASGEHDAVFEYLVASDDYELAQALDAMDAGDALDLTTLAIS